MRYHLHLAPSGGPGKSPMFMRLSDLSPYLQTIHILTQPEIISMANAYIRLSPLCNFIKAKKLYSGILDY